ncbi:hypothetical protein CHS0354_034223, partial [Potamilus streckersoni]
MQDWGSTNSALMGDDRALIWTAEEKEERVSTIDANVSAMGIAHAQKRQTAFLCQIQSTCTNGQN